MKWLTVLLATHKSNQIGKKAGFFSEEKFISVINFLQTKLSALLCIFLRVPQLNFSKNSKILEVLFFPALANLTKIFVTIKSSFIFYLCLSDF